jgi:hypothetical protein
VSAEGDSPIFGPPLRGRAQKSGQSPESRRPECHSGALQTLLTPAIGGRSSRASRPDWLPRLFAEIPMTQGYQASAVDSPWFRINLDTGNYHADPMAGMEPFEDFLEATRKVAPYLAFCHAKIWDVTDDLREPTLDYDRFFTILREINYRGPISIECMGRKDVMEMLPKCVAMLKRCRAAK